MVSQSRDLDFTQCFEHAVLLPIPLIFAIIAGAAQIFSKSRRLKLGQGKNGLIWVIKGRLNERVCRIKMVSWSYCIRPYEILITCRVLGLTRVLFSPRRHCFRSFRYFIPAISSLCIALPALSPRSTHLPSSNEPKSSYFSHIFSSHSAILAGLSSPLSRTITYYDIDWGIRTNDRYVDHCPRIFMACKFRHRNDRLYFRA